MQGFSEGSFWTKVRRHAVRAGGELVRKALQLYYAAKEPTTPTWAKTTIYSALAYFVMPADAIPDVVPVAGYADDLATLAAAIAVCARCITPEVRAKAEHEWRKWFGSAERATSE